MRRLLLVLLALSAVGAGSASAFVPPRWLLASEHLALTRIFGGATPVHTYYIPYPKKIAVVFEFDHVVRCGICSSPSVATQPRGKVIRVSFDRRTHGLTGASNGWAMQFCEVDGKKPPKSACLARSGAECADSSLRPAPATTALSEKTGQNTAVFTLRNTGPACTLEGYPTIVLTDGLGGTLAFTYRHGGDQMITSRPPGLVTVPSHGTAYFAINKYRCDVRASAVARVVHVTLPGSSGHLSLRLGHYPIIDFCREAPSRIVSVSPIVAKLASAFLGR